MKMLPRLIDFAYANGYELTGGELFRTHEQAALNAADGKGIANSLHIDRLAIDLQLFKNGVYLMETFEYAPLGVFWESLGVDHCWGGRFHDRPDADHFSITHNGIR
jgi:hypothetical protein